MKIIQRLGLKRKNNYTGSHSPTLLCTLMLDTDILQLTVSLSGSAWKRFTVKVIKEKKNVKIKISF